MKCLNCKHTEPPPMSLFSNFCRCKFKENWVFCSLNYERQCDKFQQVTDAEKLAKRAQWELVKNPVKREKNGEENEG